MMRPSRHASDQPAWDHAFIAGLYDQHAAGLLLVGHALTGSLAIAEDQLQALFEDMLARPSAYRTAKSIKSFLYQCIRNRCLNALKRRALEHDFVRQTAEKHPWIVDDGSLTKEERDNLEKLLRELPAEQAEVVILHILQELTFAEIATIQQVPVNTAISRYQYALKKLRERIKE